jgi:signal transduction histidine kinase
MAIPPVRALVRHLPAHTVAPVITFMRDRKSGLRAVVLLVLALGALYAVRAFALVIGFRETQVFVISVAAAVAAAAWFVAGRWPRICLVAVPVLVTVAGWQDLLGGVESMVLRALTLLVVAFRAATAGVRTAVLLPLVAFGALLCIYDPIGDYTRLRDVARNLLDFPTLRSLLMLFLVVVVALGTMIHRQREAALVATRRDEALRESERERDAARVRTAVARDLHDTVAHHVSAIVIRAQATLRTSSDDPDALRRTLEAVVADGGEALTSMRRAVTLLRSPEAATTRPQGSPGERLDRAVETVRSTGVSVEVSGALEGPEYAQNALVEVAREALTNVMKHSEGRHVTIDFRHRDGRFHAVVEDEGPARHREAGAPGFGIVGMNERAMSLGGTLRSGLTAEGGWRTVMSIPTEETREVADR